ncbi:MAG: hypothetical protein J0I12_12155 [Candidatus Eremiobacteraeota bacterium]|nr:hypothetical protein [Candidatus Eremiobacteraeota bacterium]
MRKRGFTIAEVLVAGGLTLMLGMCLFWVLIPSFRIAQEGQIRTELQQQGVLALQQLGSDLQIAVPTSVSLAPPVNPLTDGMIIGINPLNQSQSGAALSFEAQLVLWFHDRTSKRLWRKTFKNGDNPTGITINPLGGSSTAKPARNIMKQICDVRSGTEKSYAIGVDQFLTDLEPTTGGEVYSMRIILSKVIPGKNSSATVELFRKVMIRNHIN